MVGISHQARVSLPPPPPATPYFLKSGTVILWVTKVKVHFWGLSLRSTDAAHTGKQALFVQGHLGSPSSKGEQCEEGQGLRKRGQINARPSGPNLSCREAQTRSPNSKTGPRLCSGLQGQGVRSLAWWLACLKEQPHTGAQLRALDGASWVHSCPGWA